MNIPRVPGGGAVDPPVTGEEAEGAGRSFPASLVLLLLAIVATLSFLPFVLTDLWFLLWGGLGVGLLYLIYKTWRP